MGNLWQVCVLDTCGVKEVERRLFGPMNVSTPQQREGWIKEAEELVKRIFT
jgi:putative NADPH-quinone reductase